MASIDTNTGFFDNNQNHFQVIILETREGWAYVQIIKNFKLIEKRFHVGQPRFFISEDYRFLHIVGFSFYHKINLDDLSSSMIEKQEVLLTPEFIVQIEMAKTGKEPVLIELILNNLDRSIFEKKFEQARHEAKVAKAVEKKLVSQIAEIEKQLSRIKLSSIFSKAGFAVEVARTGEIIYTKGSFKDHKKEGRCKILSKDYQITAIFQNDKRVSPNVTIFCPKKHVLVEGEVDLRSDNYIEDLKLTSLKYYRAKIEPETTLSFVGLNFSGYGTMTFSDGNWVHGMIEDNKFAMSKANKRKVISFGGQELVIREISDAGIRVDSMLLRLDYIRGRITLVQSFAG